MIFNIKIHIIASVLFLFFSATQAKEIDQTERVGERSSYYSSITIDKIVVGHKGEPYFCIKTVWHDLDKTFCASSAAGASRNSFYYLLNFARIANLNKSEVRVYDSNETVLFLKEKYPTHKVLIAISNCKNDACL